MRIALRVPLTLLAACVLAMLFAGAKCYPPGTRVVVFMQGVYSEYDPRWDGTKYEPYRDMKAAFVAAGYDDAVLLDFSYRGGTVDEDGLWRPDLYTCGVTDRRADDNAIIVENMLRAYRAKHPQAHFTLVGHSLGGYVAYRAGVRDAARAPEERLEIDAVVTLDAPLLGISADKKIAIDAINCNKTYLAGAELVAEKADEALAELRRAEVASLHEAGIRLATIGNEGDCLYNLRRCANSTTFVDDTATQYLEGADLVVTYDTSGNAFATHFLIMRFGPAVQEVVRFVGAP